MSTTAAATKFMAADLGVSKDWLEVPGLLGKPGQTGTVEALGGAY
jgi:hypothetical protein